MGTRQHNLAGLAPEDRQALEAWLAEFDQSWTEERLALLTRLLPPPGSLARLPALVELVKIDLRHQWQRGRQPGVESYLSLYPELGTSATAPADLVRAELELRRQHGVAEPWTELERRFPRQVAELRRLLEGDAGSCAEDSARVTPPVSGACTPGPATFVPAPVALPAQFGRYRILRTLGRGGMGHVYLAEDTQLERQVALKVPQFTASEGSEVLQRFHREARLAATLRHPNICPVYDVGALDGVHYLTMAFVEGQTLAELARAGPLEPRLAATLGYKLALALHEAHQHGIIHRDLKPANVMIDRRGEPIVMDFGLARRLNGPAPHLTGTGQTLGTPAYMAPEQVDGDSQRIGPATDMYSLGVILYELLTGRLPFEGPFAAVLVLVGDQKPPPPSTLRAGLDPRLEAICLRALAPRPKDRFADMAELAAALAAVAQPEQSVSLPPPASRRVVLLAGAAAVAGLVCGAVGFLVFQPRSTPHVPEEQPPSAALVRAESNSATARTALPLPTAQPKEEPPRVLPPIAPKKEPPPGPAPPVQAAPPRPPPPDPAVHYQRGRDLAAAGRSREAVAEFSKALDLGQRDAAVYRERGHAHLDLGDLPAALQDLNTALKLDPGDATAHYTRGLVLARSRKYADAVRDFQATVERTPDLFEAHCALGDAHRELHQDVPAEAAYTRALELRRTDPSCYLNRGRVRFRLKCFAEAIDDYDEVIDRLGWKKAVAYRLRGEAYLAREYFTRARDNFSRALAQAPDDAVAYHLRGLSRFRMNELEPAYSDFSEATRLDPDNPVYHHERGLAAIALKDPDVALLDFNDAVRLGKDHADLLVFLLDRGNTHRHLRHFPEALADYDRALERRPKYAQAFRERGVTHAAKDDWTAARADLNRAILLEPNNADYHLWRGRCHDRLGDASAALADYTAAIQFGPQVSAHHAARGKFYARTGRFKEALQDYSGAIRLAPEQMALYQERILVYRALREPDGMLSDCAVVLKRDPKNADAHYLRGLAQQMKDQVEPAIVAYTEAVRWNPNLYAAHLNRGSLYARRGQPGDFDRAIADFSEAHRIDPKAPLPLQNRAAVYERQGRKDLAEQDRAQLRTLGR